MKSIIFSIGIFLMSLSLHAQTLQVNGKDLITTTGQNLKMRGINYGIIDEGLGTLANPAQLEFKISEAAKTGSNTIRIPWYTNGTHFMDISQPGTVQGLINDGTLSNLIGLSYQNGMIPILELHDGTCGSDWNYFNNVLVPWWIQPTILDIIEEHKAYLIVNIANEFGEARWTGNVPAAMNIFKNNYIQAVSTLRNAGIQVPIMIDAPDCGSSSSELLTVAQEILDADPQENIIFSTHAYWIAYANTQAAVNAKLNEIDQSPFCYILGEVANVQDEYQLPCEYDIEHIYQWVMAQACALDMSWLAWTYTQDFCPSREMTTNGVFNTLTPYGEEVVYDDVFGLLSAGACRAEPLSVIDFKGENTSIKIFPNPAQNAISLTNFTQIESIAIYDISGKLFFHSKDSKDSWDISFLSTGLYLVKIKTLSNQWVTQKLIKK